jgi:hypothetical protein
MLLFLIMVIFTAQKYKKSGAMIAPDVSRTFLFVSFSAYD